MNDGSHVDPSSYLEAVNPIGHHGLGAGLGAPDARLGHGYGSLEGGPASKMRLMPAGYPYDELDLDDLDDDEEDSSEDDDDIAVRTSQQAADSYRPSDFHGMGTRDRRTFGIGMGPPSLAGEGRLADEMLLRELSSMIRLRPKSSEPGGQGTMYGWSHPPLTKTNVRQAGAIRPRYTDVLRSADDVEEDWDQPDGEHPFDPVDEVIVRNYVHRILASHV